MKRWLIIVLLLIASIAGIAQSKKNTFTVENCFGTVKQYVVNEEFLQRFANFGSNYVPREYRIWMVDIYNALKQGVSVVYNVDSNTIVGMTSRWHIKDQSVLSASRSSWQKTWDAFSKNDAYNFRKALEYLEYFKD